MSVRESPVDFLQKSAREMHTIGFSNIKNVLVMDRVYIFLLRATIRSIVFLELKK